MYLLYDLILLALTLVLIPYYLVRGAFHGKVRRGIRERLGIYSAGRLAPLQGKRVIWIHAVSVGETRAAIPLIKALRKTWPEAALIISNVTETGQQIARGIGETDLSLYFPYDLSWVVRRVLRRVNPALIVIVETEIWPNFIREARRQAIPIALVNGRISDRSFPRYRALRPLFQPILQDFSAFCMQTALDGERIALMGAPAERIEVTHNLKFDMQAPVPDVASVAALKETYRLPADLPVWVAGSTHPGEEEIVLQVYRDLVSAGVNFVLVLVPRHPERCRALAEDLANRGVPCTLRSAIDGGGEPLRAGEVLLVDTIGELMKFYAVSDLVFVGGSLVSVGGHNILEASLLKKPVIFGPYMHNFKEISRLVLAAQGGIQVADAPALAEAVRRLIEDPVLRQSLGEGGNGLLLENAGATDRTLATLRRLLES
ncbi:3-deoxy-D-manno-octulosonic-acid transferase [Desulfuromonas soudanensis]|uniref:3-deoxy-D-manno-octulosonic acid transferase n=1 Tax=Desulfuromonas soudanensis TaxID=1603606 RepID=A0A0M3QFL7_9BACT|nr:3-deoxy-D-manno-octulosonic acid transferase [Desulfuromonas soudanensis]ALC16449.1 3-deoxy-D-manno-octulosonic-acid transferase [Desulfuromonas soudanensis]